MKLQYLLICIFCCCIISCQETGKFKIAVSLCNDDMWHQTVMQELYREASFYPDVELIIKENKNGDDRQQMDNINAFIRQKADLIVISAGNASFFTPVVRNIHQSGIPVIILDQKVETDDYTAYIGGDNYMIGNQIGLFIVHKLKGKGTVAEIRGRLESLTDIERHKGFMDAVSGFPDIRLVAEKRADFDTAVAEKMMSGIIAENKLPDIVFAMDDLTAKGVYNAYKKAGIKQPFTIGVDALPGEGGGIDNVIRGYQDISFIYPTGGDKVLETARNILYGKPFQKNNILYTGVVDSSNARLIQQQKEHIHSEQQKSAQVNNRLTHTLDVNSRQQTFLIVSISVLFFIVLLLVIAIRAYRSKSKAEKRISGQYAQIGKQKQQLEELSGQLEKAVNAKLMFFTNISHEFKTPLSLIIDPLKSILASGELSDENRYKVELASRNSKILLDLISQIIDFNKYENHNESLQLSRIDLKEFLSGLNELFINLVKQKQVDFGLEAGNGDFSVCLDKRKIERVYLNILSNAFRHVPQNGTIRIILDQKMINDKAYACITVYNNGSPIPEDRINSIFNRFYQIEASEAGSGIGLALANAMVGLHHGKIEACNTGGGVEFRITLPFAQDVPEMDQESLFISESLAVYPWNEDAMTEKCSGAENESIVLVVEDNEDIRNYLNHILSADYKVIDAPNGRSGLEKAKNYQPDAIISDVMMPEMDGLELCRHIKDNISTCHIPVILLTARSLREHESEGIENGADVYITKPFDSDWLKLRLQKLMENRKKMIESFTSNFVIGPKKETLGTIQDEYINRFQDYVIENISDTSLNVEIIAAASGESYIQMYRKIKTLTGQTPSELIKLIRLRYARQLISLKTKNIASVAYEAGFSSPSYFTRCFKEFYKESPTEYLKRIEN